MKTLRSFVLLALAACSDDFVKGWLVDQPRVLGARLEGQQISWLVARATHGEWAYAVCADTKLNAPRCDTPVTAAGSGVSEGEVVTMQLASAPAGSLVLAAFCPRGVALNAVDFSATCREGTPLLASMKVGVEQPQPAVPVLRAPDGCVPPSSHHELGFTFRAEDRDPGETLLASTTVTDGELDRQYTALEAEAAAPRDVTVPWTAPAVAGTTTIYLVLRDGRGGTAFTSARVCVR